MDTKKPKTKKKIETQIVVTQARYNFNDAEKSKLGLDASRAQSEVAAYEQQLQSIKSDYKGKIEASECKRNECFRKLEDGFEMRQVQALVEFFPEKRRKAFYLIDDSKKSKKGEFLREEDMTAADFHRELPLKDEKKVEEKKDAFENPVLSNEEAEAATAAIEAQE